MSTGWYNQEKKKNSIHFIDITENSLKENSLSMKFCLLLKCLFLLRSSLTFVEKLAYNKANTVFPDMVKAFPAQ